MRAERGAYQRSASCRLSWLGKVRGRGEASPTRLDEAEAASLPARTVDTAMIGSRNGALEAPQRGLLLLRQSAEPDDGGHLLFRGRSPLSRFIQWGPRALPHAGMAAWWGRLAVFRSRPRRRVHLHVERSLQLRGPGGLVVLKPEHDCKLDRAQLVDTARAARQEVRLRVAVRLIFRMTLQRFVSPIRWLTLRRSSLESRLLPRRRPTSARRGRRLHQPGRSGHLRLSDFRGAPSQRREGSPYDGRSARRLARAARREGPAESPEAATL